MTIRDSDKLLVGRGDTSYYVTLSDSGLTNDIPITGTEPGKPITGDIDLDSGVFINIAGNGAGLNIKQNFWGALSYDGTLQLEWGQSGLKTGTDINMKGGQIDFSNTTAEEQYSNTGSRAPWDESLRGHGIHWLKAPEHKYDAVNKEYVDNNLTQFLGRSGGNLTGDLSFTDSNAVKTRFLDSGQNTNLTLSRNGEARIVCASEQITMQKPVRLVNDGTDDDHAVSKSYVDTKVSSISESLQTGMSVPTGATMFWGHAAPVPAGWVVLDGGDFDINEYPLLHNLLNQSEGYVEGKLPDYRDRFVCGIGTKHFGAPGAKLGELTKRPTTNFTTNSQSLTHSHGFTMNHSHTLTVTGTTNTAGGHSHTYSAWTSSAKGGGTGTSNPNSRSTSLTTGTAGSHSHTVSVTGTVGTYTSTTKTTAAATLSHSHSVTGGGDAVNRPLTIIGYWIIKT